MRRLFIFATLILTLAALYRLRQISDDWHYLVPSEPGRLLYAADFETDGAEWQQYRGANPAAIVDGTMQLEVQESQTLIFSAAAHYFTDFDLAAETQALEGDLNNAYGVVFRQKDSQNFYTFLISSDGFYRVKRRVDNEPRILSNWHPSPVIKQGIDTVNRIRVVGHGDRFQFYINGERVELCVPDNPDGESTPNNFTGECTGGEWTDTLVDDSIGYGRIGVVVEVAAEQPTGPVIAFDNVVVYGPRPIASNQE